MEEKCETREDIKWNPSAILDVDLLMYIRSARSMAAFAGMCDGGSTEDGCAAAAMDETTISSLHTLHDCNYDTTKALQALVTSINPKSIEKRWSEEDVKKFVKGLRTCGKNFFKIRTELLPDKKTGEIVEYYYFWKKTPAAANTRPHRRHRRGLRRQSRPPRPQSNEYLDVSSASEVSEDESDASEATRDLSAYYCRHCNSTKSRDWHHSGKNNELYCSECRLHYKKYGEDRPLLSASSTNTNPQSTAYLFRPVKEEHDKAGKSARRNEDGRCSPETATDSPFTTGGGRKSPGEDSVDSVNSSSANPALPASVASAVSGAVSAAVSDKKPIDLFKQRRGFPDTDPDNKRKKTSERSDSPSGSYSSSTGSIYNDNEDNANDGDVETNQDDVTSCTSSSVPSPAEVADQDYKPPTYIKNPPTTTTTTTPATEENTPVVTPVAAVQPVTVKKEPGTEEAASDDDSDSSSDDEDDDDDGTSDSSSSSDSGDATEENTSAGEGEGDTVTPPAAVKQSNSPPPQPQQLLPLPHIKQEPVEQAPVIIAPTPITVAPTTSSSHLPSSTLASTHPPPPPPPLHATPPLSGAPVAPPHLPPGLIMPPPAPTSLTAATVTVPSTGGSISSTSSHVPPTVPPPPLHSGSQSGLPGSIPRLPHHHLPPHALQGPPPLVSVPPGGLPHHLAALHPQQHLQQLAAHAASIKQEPMDTTTTTTSSANTTPTAKLLPTTPPVAPLPQAAMSPSQQQQHQQQHHRAHTPQQRPGSAQDQRSRSRSRSPLNRDSDSDSEPPRSPEPEPRVVNIELHRSKNAIFMKHWDRGWNSCSRCDLEFKPTPESWIGRKRDKRLPLPPPPTIPTSRSGLPSRATSVPPSRSPGTSKEGDIKKEDGGRLSANLGKKSDSPPENQSADAQITSALMINQQHHGAPYPPPPPPGSRLSPRPPYHPLAGPDPTPALRQLSEYARPHTLGQDPATSRGLPYGIGSLGGPGHPGHPGHPPPPPHPSMDPYYRMASMFPPGSRERLELELDREKRERDAREREIRERELREIEIREKFKQELDMKPPGFDRLPPGAGLDPHWAEIQRRYGGIPPAHLAGIYPPTSMASDILRGERDRMERLNELRQLGLAPPPGPEERMNIERFHAERLAAMAADPMLRLQMAGNSNAAAAAAATAAAVAASQHMHTHTHAHLHLHQPDGPQGPPPHGGPHGLPPPPHHGLLAAAAAAAAGADPLSGSSSGGGGGGGSAGPPPGHPAAGHQSQALMEAARQQEILYRDLLARPPYSSDPVLAHQLTAQMSAQQEAIQRQLAMERERERLASHTPGGHMH